MNINVSSLMWWFFAILLTASVKLGLDQVWGISSSNLWGSIGTSIIAFAVGFGLVGWFKRHVTQTVIIGGAQK